MYQRLLLGCGSGRDGFGYWVLNRRKRTQVGKNRNQFVIRELVPFAVEQPERNASQRRNVHLPAPPTGNELFRYYDSTRQCESGSGDDFDFLGGFISHVVSGILGLQRAGRLGRLT